MSTSGINLHILFFATTRELAKTSSATFTVPTTVVNASDLISQLCERFNLSSVQENLILAHNENYIQSPDEEIHLREGDEIAIIPPISGG